MLYNRKAAGCLKSERIHKIIKIYHILRFSDKKDSRGRAFIGISLECDAIKNS